MQANPVVSPVDQFNIYPALRYDYYSDFGGAVSPSLGVNWRITGSLLARMTGSYDFSPPTFNDLYWEPGGNLDLRPERSKRVEAGLQWGEPEYWWGEHKVNAYYMELENGIQWINSGGIWTPENVKYMQSRGVSWRFLKTVQVNEVKLQWGQLLDWTRSNITEGELGGEEVEGNQLAYVPKRRYKTYLTFNYDNYYLRVNYRWTSTRFTDNSHLSSLDPYELIDLTTGYTQSLGPVKLRGSVKVENLTDSDYQYIQWYPMPGRHFQFSLTLNYTF
jgi:iron complex outermembrane receptor protein